MMADDHSCAPMNPYPGEIYHTREKKINLYGDQIEVPPVPALLHYPTLNNMDIIYIM